MSYQDPYQSGYGQQPQQPGYGQQPGYDPAYTQPYSGGPSYPATSGGPAYPITGGPVPGAVPPGPYYTPVVVAPSATTNTMAILALVFAFVFAPLGIVFGHMGRKQIRERGEQGDGLALAGMIIGYIHTGLWVLICGFYIIFFVILVSASNSTSNYGEYVIRLALGF
jgi:hypothetical protein